MRGTGSRQVWNYFVDGILPQAGIQQVSTDGRSVGWDNSKGAATLKWFTDFARGDKAPNSILFPGAYDAFRLELSAMYVGGNWTMSELATVAPNLKYATAVVPSSDDGRQATYGNVWGNAVTSRSLGQAQAGAWKFLRFLANYDNMLYWAEMTGEIPMRIQVQSDPRFLGHVGRLRPFLKQMAFARMSLKKDERLYKSAMIDAADEILLNDADPSWALHNAARRVNAMLEVQ